MMRHYDFQEPFISMDDFWLVTHIVFVLSAYSSIKIKESKIPFLFKA